MKRRNLPCTPVLVAFGLLLPLASAPAHARSADQAPADVLNESHISPPRDVGGGAPRVEQEVSISFRDLNLSTPSGARALFERIERAADAVCTTPAERTRHWIDREAMQDCRRASISSALVRLNHPLVTAVAGRSWRPTTRLAVR